MGTRNLTIVKYQKKTKVAQYGQWDGYPTGQGQTIAAFLRTADLKKFKKQVKALEEYTPSQIKAAYKKAGADPKSQWITSEVSSRVNQAHPALCREYGADILNLIYNGEVTKVVLNEDFKNDSISCEYWYEIDLDKETVTMNGETFTFKQWTRKGKMEQLEKRDDD